MIRTYRAFLAFVAFACVAAPLSHADTVATFNFDSDTPVTTQTPFTDSNNGVFATFSSPFDPGGFYVGKSIFSTLTGNALSSVTLGDNELDVTFDQSLSSASLLFGTDNSGIPPQPFDLQAFDNGTLVGTQTATGTVPPGFNFPEGSISFDGSTFNRLVLTTPTSNGFAIDDLTVTTAAVVVTPEPPAITLVLLGLVVLGARFGLRRNLQQTPLLTGNLL